MAIVNISSLSYSSGDAVAQNLASVLGYKLVGDEIFQQAAERSGISQDKLRQAFHSMPLLLGMSASSRKQCIAHVQAALASQFLEPDLVFHGRFGQFLAKGVSHVLNVRIQGKSEDRVARLADQKGIDAKEAEKILQKEDRQRIMISKLVFDRDDDDTSQFDLVVNSSQMDVDTMVEVITDAAKLKRYSPMSYSIQCMKDIALARTAKAELADLDPDINVESNRGNLKIRTRIHGSAKKKRIEKIKERMKKFEDLKSLDIDVVQDALGRFTGSLR